MARKFASEEHKILSFWKENNIFEQSVDRDPKKGDYIFYDGPPFATGLPHYGHIVGSILKDVVPRYWTMKGYRVERKWGWDCHGLPIENLVEKELDLHSKKDIEELGVAKFNTTCHSKVLMYADEWKKIIPRLGRFVDMERDYKTMDKEYMESIWWVFKQLWDKGLVYEHYKSMHICPRCETTLSQSEVTEGYQMIKDLSVVAQFELVDEPKTYVLAWTTTPWTLPGNTALAFGPEIEYVIVEKKHDESGEVEKFILAKERLEDIFEGKEYTVIETLKGSDLSGRRYKPLFPYFVQNNAINNIENAYVTVTADFVTTEDGTGVVHIAPAFGEDDMKVGQDYNLPFIQHVGMDGRYTEEVTDWAGQEVKPKDDHMHADIEIVKYLAHNGILFSKKKYEHSYPHCWRCDSPLLNYATNSWFVNVTKIKPRALELAEEINWMPGHIKEGRFGNWLKGARDWSISRQRYWGSVMPVWRSEDGSETIVFGSVEELEKACGQKIEDLHKHVVDEITFTSEKGNVMRRIPDVLDCWFESGSMPYAQLHYPFENKEKFEENFPAQFIAEGVDQTRAWFYYLHVLSTALQDKPAFQNVIVNGIVLAEDGKKMSKRLQNYPDPMLVMDKYGADALRLYLLSSPVVRADDMNFTEAGVSEVLKKILLILWNVYSFYDMYADDELLTMHVSSEHIMDEWIKAQTHTALKTITEQMDAYDLMSAMRTFGDYLNELSTWYVRRSRDRFKSEDKSERAAALQTLREVLMIAVKMIAPAAPFITEDIYQQLKTDGDALSVHLSDWPEFDSQYIEHKVLDRMEMARVIVEAGLHIRSTNQLKVRQALSELQVRGEAMDDSLVEIIKEELNIKSLSFVDELTSGDSWIGHEHKHVQVALNTEITDELRRDGYAREIIRHINLLRKDSGLTIDDIAVLAYTTDNSDIIQAFTEFNDEIKKQTLLSTIKQTDDVEGKELTIGGASVTIGLK